jgi:hypothetical protein
MAERASRSHAVTPGDEAGHLFLLLVCGRDSEQIGKPFQ